LNTSAFQFHANAVLLKLQTFLSNTWNNLIGTSRIFCPKLCLWQKEGEVMKCFAWFYSLLSLTNVIRNHLKGGVESVCFYQFPMFWFLIHYLHYFFS